MIDWLNDNAGAVQALAMLLLVVVTVTYAGLVWSQAQSGGKLADETTRLVQQTQRLATETRRQTRPYVFVEVVRRGQLVDTSVRNSGERGAEDVKIAVEQDVHVGDRRGFLDWPLIRQPIPFLPPGRCVSQTVAHIPSMSPGLPSIPSDKRVLRYTISYRDGEEEYEEAHAYDLSWLAPIGGDQLPLAGDYLGQLKEEVRQLKELLAQGMDSLTEILRARMSPRP